jgi:hypothetical protein
MYNLYFTNFYLEWQTQINNKIIKISGGKYDPKKFQLLPGVSPKLINLFPNFTVNNF